MFSNSHSLTLNLYTCAGLQKSSPQAKLKKEHSSGIDLTPINCKDLEEFSDELKEAVNAYVER